MFRKLALPVVAATVLLTGCATLSDVFTGQFLDTFQPFGQDSVTAPQRQGVVIVVVENLTEEWRHGETASFEITFDGEGQGQFVQGDVKAVPRQLRTIVSGHRRTTLLPCTVNSVTVTATVSQTELRANDVEIPTGQDQTATQTQFVPQCNLTVETAAVASVTTEVQCGDIVVFGLLDNRDREGDLIFPDFGAQAADQTDVVYNPGTVISGQITFTDPNTGEPRTVTVSTTACTQNVQDTAATLQTLLEEQGIQDVQVDLVEQGFQLTNDLSVISDHFQYPVGYTILSLKADSRISSLQQLLAAFENMASTLASQ